MHPSQPSRPSLLIYLEPPTKQTLIFTPPRILAQQVLPVCKVEDTHGPYPTPNSLSLLSRRHAPFPLICMYVQSTQTMQLSAVDAQGTDPSTSIACLTHDSRPAAMSSHRRSASTATDSIALPPARRSEKQGYAQKMACIRLLSFHHRTRPANILSFPILPM